MKIFLKFIFLFISIATIGQESKLRDTLIKRNTIYAEAFGQGLNSSLSFDRLYHLNKKIKTSFTAGIVIVPIAEGFGDGSYFGVPVSYNFIFYKKSHHIEIGLGFTILGGKDIFNWSYYYSYFTPKIGYRFQRHQGGLFFRATLTPMIAFINAYFEKDNYRNFEYFTNVVNIDYPIFPWAGLSIGYTLKK
ncbi:MAG: hypothetical protein V1781_05185 [Bacteroidota bacterium]